MNAPAAATTASQSSFPPGPPAWKGLSNLRAIRKDALSFLQNISREYGGVARFYVGYIPITFVSDPDAVRHVPLVAGEALAGQQSLPSYGQTSGVGERGERVDAGRQIGAEQVGDPQPGQDGNK